MSQVKCPIQRSKGLHGVYNGSFGEDVLTLLRFKLGEICLIWTCGQKIIAGKVLRCVCGGTPFDTLLKDHVWGTSQTSVWRAMMDCQALMVIVVLALATIRAV